MDRGDRGFKFGDRVKSIFASKSNPHRLALFVRYCGDSIECTDGLGEFWTAPIEGIVLESMSDEEAKQLDKLWNQRFGHRVILVGILDD